MRRPRRLISLHFSTAEWLLITAIVAALLSGGYAYAQHTADLFTGIVACIGMVCLILVTFSYYLLNPRQPSRSMRYGNVTITPLRRAPLTNLRTRWNLFKLKMKYRRNNSR